MDEGIRAVSEGCRRTLFRIVELLSPVFPLHAQALHGEMAGTKLTMERWSRILYVLLSLRSVPGVCLSDGEKDVRAHALRAIPMAECMYRASAAVRSIGFDPLAAARELSNSLDERMSA